MTNYYDFEVVFAEDEMAICTCLSIIMQAGCGWRSSGSTTST
jgi:hypothetical protein